MRIVAEGLQRISRQELQVSLRLLAWSSQGVGPHLKRGGRDEGHDAADKLGASGDVQTGIPDHDHGAGELGRAIGIDLVGRDGEELRRGAGGRGGRSP